VCANVQACPALFAENAGYVFSVSAFWRYRVSLQRKKRCQQIIGLDDEPFSVAVGIDAKKKPGLVKCSAML